jgi:tetratricopeptide (TPR) repeat protein
MKNYLQAIAHYDQALAMQPNFIEVYHSSSIGFPQIEMIEEAIATCQMGIDKDPSFHALYFILAMCFEKIHDDQRAIALFSSFLAASGLDSYAIFFQLAKFHGNQNATQAALKLLRSVYSRKIAVLQMLM